MWCGHAVWQAADNAAFWQGQDCSLVVLEAADGSGRPVDEDFGDPIRITHYTPYADGTDCQIQGVDDDGYTGGLEAVLARDAGDCTVNPTGSTLRVVQRWTIVGGTLTYTPNVNFTPMQLAEPVWSLRAEVEIEKVVYDPAEPDFGTPLLITGSISHDAGAKPNTLTLPEDPRATPPCEVDGCYEVQFNGELLAGAEYQACRDLLATTQTT